MHLVEIFLPIADNKGYRIGEGHFNEIRRELVETFGGVTVYARGPALGVTEAHGHTRCDDIVIMEVMTDTLDRAWWKAFRNHTEEQFKQECILIRAREIEQL